MRRSRPSGDVITKPDDVTWAGAPVAITSKVFSVNINLTLAYKVTPTLTVGAGVQIEYLKLRLNRGTFDFFGPASGARSYETDGWAVCATAGVLWQPAPGTSIGLGYRSQVNAEASGTYTRQTASILDGPGVTTDATGKVTLPEEVTFSFRQVAAPGLTLLGTVEWTHWSRLGNLSAVSPDCNSPTYGTGVCEVINLNYRDGWFYALVSNMPTTPSSRCAPASPTRRLQSGTARATFSFPTPIACS